MGRYKLPYSLFKRGKYWYYRTYTIDGVRTVPKTTGCKTKSEAVRFCEALYISGSLFDSDISFYNYAHNFFDDDSFYIKDRAQALAYNTIIGHRYRYNANIEPYFKDFKLKDINYIELRRFRTFLLERGLKISSLNLILSTLKIILETAYKSDLISHNPFDKLDTLTAEDSKKTAFTLDQVKLLYNSIEDKQYKKLVLFLALTGLRISEALGVRSQDVKKTEKTLYIDLTKQQTSKGGYAPLKTKLVRYIPITEDINKLIGNELILYRDFYKCFKSIRDILFKDNSNLYSIHSLRHFFITNSKACNINPVKVKKISGHKLDNKVEDTYTNFTPDDLIDILSWQKSVYEYITK